MYAYIPTLLNSSEMPNFSSTYQRQTFDDLRNSNCFTCCSFASSMGKHPPDHALVYQSSVGKRIVGVASIYTWQAHTGILQSNKCAQKVYKKSPHSQKISGINHFNSWLYKISFLRFWLLLLNILLKKFTEINVKCI